MLLGNLFISVSGISEMILYIERGLLWNDQLLWKLMVYVAFVRNEIVE